MLCPFKKAVFDMIKLGFYHYADLARLFGHKPFARKAS